MKTTRGDSISIVSLTLALLCAACGGGSGNDSDSPTGDGAFTPAQISLRETTKQSVFELLDEKLVFVDAAGREWEAPKGTLTDGATVPRAALTITNGRFDTRYLKAAIVHDAWCQDFNAEICPDQYQKRPWPEVHRMFHEACITGGTPKLLADLMYNAVYWFGPRWGDPEDSLDSVPPEDVQAEFEATEAWLEEGGRSVEGLDTRLRERELELRSRTNVSIPEVLREMKPRTLDPETLRSGAGPRTLRPGGGRSHAQEDTQGNLSCVALERHALEPLSKRHTVTK